MRISVRLVFAVLMIVTAACSLAPAQAPAQTPAQVPAQNPFDAFQHFSATVSGSPLKWKKLQVYRSGNQMRANYDSINEYRITNLVKRGGWVIRPKQCSRMTMMDVATYPFFAYSDFSVERFPTADKETIDGHSCKVENFTFKPKDGRPQSVKVKLWEAEDLNGFPIQIEVQPISLPKFTMNYADVNLEPPDPKLFRLPATCRAGVHQKKKQPASTSKAPTQPSPKPPQ